jgi:hypothetical protein
MTAQTIPASSRSKSQSASLIAVLFFLIGLPNLYSALSQKSPFELSALIAAPFIAVGLALATSIGGLSYLLMLMFSAI